MVTISTAINAYAAQAQQGKRLSAAKQVYQQLEKDIQSSKLAPADVTADKTDENP